MMWLAAALLALAALFCAPTASALPPGPICPGTGADVDVLVAEGGYCNMLYNLPDPVWGLTYVHCEFGGFVIAGTFVIVGVSNCWRVQQSTGDRIPDPPFNHDAVADVPQSVSGSS